jgi:hypothetical protein
MQLDNGGHAAMLFDLLHQYLGDWHPRKMPEDCGLADQQALSLSPLDTWWLLCNMRRYVHRAQLVDEVFCIAGFAGAKCGSR